MAFVARHWLKMIWVTVLTLAFFPVAGLVAQFAGNLSLATLAFEQAPRWVISRIAVDRLAYEAEAQFRLRADCREIAAGALRFRLPPGVPSENLQKSGSAIVGRLMHLLPGSPPLPVIEMRKLFDTYGRFDNPFALAIDPDGDEPLRTVAHELTHLYLLWALIPGLPVDCPRWLNEGLSELVSGEIMADDAGWRRYALVRARDNLDLHVVSPAFSWSGYAVEWAARDAAAMLIELHGEEAFRRMLIGLRLARPFYSIYPIISGRTLESFELSWKERFSRQRVIANLSTDEILPRLEWLADNRGMVELQPLLQNMPESILAGDVQKKLIGRARVREARRSLEQGNLRDALGWLRGVAKGVSGYSDLQALIAVSRQTGVNAAAEVTGEAGEKNNVAALADSGRSLPQQMRQGRLIWLFAQAVAIACAVLLVAVYHYLRALVVPKLQKCWQSHVTPGLDFKWLVVGITGLAGGWFLRFLVISMIPYAGLAALPDLQRIILAEVLVIILWVVLSWQLQRWHIQSASPGGVDADERAVAHRQISPAVFVLFLAVGVLSPLLAVMQNGWQRTGFVPGQALLSMLLFLAGSAAFGLVVWSAARRWNRLPGRHFAPAIIYALFRGGLAADPFGSLFALAAGWRLSELMQRSRQIWPAIFGDILLCAPALLLCTGWFPTFDPVAGFWYGGSGAVVWWLPAAVILLLFRGAWLESGRKI